MNTHEPECHLEEAWCHLEHQLVLEEVLVSFGGAVMD